MARRARGWGSVSDPWGSIDRAWGVVYGTLENHKPQYHVVLGGRGLMLGDRTRGLAQPFAAPLRTAAPSVNSRLGEQAVEITGWQGGEGTLKHLPENASRYRRGGGINIYERSGQVSLGPYMAAPAALQTAWDGITALGVYREYLMLGKSDGKVYRWNGSTLDLAGDTGKSTGGVTCFGVWENNLYIGNGEDGAVWRWLDETLLTSFAANFTIGAYSGGTVQACTALSNHMRGNFYTHFYAARTTNAGLCGETANTGGTTSAADSSTLVTPDYEVSCLVQFGDDLLAVSVHDEMRISRLYAGSDDDPVVWRLRGTIRDCVITCGAVLDDAAYFGDAINGRIWRWDGDNLTLYHQLGSDTDPYTAEITGMAAWRGGLWISILDEDNTCALLRDNGSTDFSRPVTGLSGTTPGPLAVWNGQLHYATQATGAAKLFRTDGTFAASGEVESALIDGSLPGELKLWTSARISHSALVAGQSVEVRYQLEDSGSWVSLGTSSTVGSTDAEFAFPTNVTAKLLGLKILLAGSAGSSTPLTVYDLAAMFRLTRRPLHEWTLRVRLEGRDAFVSGGSAIAAHRLSLADGVSSETLTGEQLCDAIQDLVDAGVAVAFLDIDRREQYTVQIEEFSDSIEARLSQGDVMDAGWEMVGSLKLREI